MALLHALTPLRAGLSLCCHCCSHCRLTPSADASTPLPQCQEVLAFLKGQLVHDVIGPELAVSLSLLAYGSEGRVLCWCVGVLCMACLRHRLASFVLPPGLTSIF